MGACPAQRVRDDAHALVEGEHLRERLKSQVRLVHAWYDIVAQTKFVRTVVTQYLQPYSQKVIDFTGQRPGYKLGAKISIGNKPKLGLTVHASC